MVARFGRDRRAHTRIPSPAIALALLLVGAALPVLANHPLYLVDSMFDPPLATRVYQVDPVTGVATLKTDLGSAYTPSLAMAAADGAVLYMTGTDLSRGCEFSCVLLRVELDPASTTPPSVTDLGPVRHNGAVVSGIVGMTFRNDGTLYVTSQDTDSLYRVDLATAELTLVGHAGVDIHGGDITFDALDRLWLWTNLGPNAGLYQMNPATGAATLADRRQNVNFAGLAALGHGNVMYGSSPPDDRLYEVLPVTGMTGVSALMTLNGVRFDHKRGDLDSPYCVSSAECDDFNPCTTDRCTPGGCRNLFLDATCDGIDDDCDGSIDEDYVPTPTTCGVGACAGNTGQLACVGGVVTDTCDPFGGAAPNDATCDGIDDDCDGFVDEEYAPVAAPCPAGSCAATAPTSCVAGQVVNECRPSPTIFVSRPSAGVAEISWSAIAGVNGYDAVKGDLTVLRPTAGDYASAITGCLANDFPGTSVQDPDPVPVGGGLFYLVRGADCPGGGSYDTAAPSQIGSRDPGIASSPLKCP